MKGYVHIEGRMLLVKLATQSINTTVIQVYMPTTEYSDHEFEEIHEEMQKWLDQTKGEDNVILMGDLNS